MSWEAFIGGVIAGLVATTIWAALAWDARRRRRNNAFGPIAGQYSMTRKSARDLAPETVVIRVDKNVLTVHYEGLPDGDAVHGEIIMNDHLPSAGRGHYEHLKAGEQLFGFWEIQRGEGATLFMHGTYADPKTFEEVVSGFIWARIGD